MAKPTNVINDEATDRALATVRRIYDEAQRAVARLELKGRPGGQNVAVIVNCQRSVLEQERCLHIDCLQEQTVWVVYPSCSLFLTSSAELCRRDDSSNAYVTRGVPEYLLWGPTARLDNILFELRQLG